MPNYLQVLDVGLIQLGKLNVDIVLLMGIAWSLDPVRALLMDTVAFGFFEFRWSARRSQAAHAVESPERRAPDGTPLGWDGRGRACEELWKEPSSVRHWQTICMRDMYVTEQGQGPAQEERESIAQADAVPHHRLYTLNMSSDLLWWRNRCPAFCDDHLY